MTLEEVEALEHLTVVGVHSHPRVGEYYDVRTDKENGWYVHSTTWEGSEDIADPVDAESEDSVDPNQEDLTSEDVIELGQEELVKGKEGLEQKSLPKTYKWATALYAIDDISTVQVVHTSEIPEDGIVC